MSANHHHHQGPNEDEQPPKKRRGTYKKWLSDPSVPIPRTTLLSRQRTQLQADEHNPIDCIQQPNLTGIAQVVNEIQAEEIPCSHQQQSDKQPIPMSVDDHCIEERPAIGEQTRKEIEPQDNSHERALSNENLQGNHSDQETEAVPKVKSDIDYINKYSLDDRLHPDFSTTRLDALLMILHLAMRHSHTQHFIEDQIKFVNVLFDSNVLDVSHHIFKNLFKPSIKIFKHFFCSDCDIYLGTQDDFDDNVKFIKCKKCLREINVKSLTSGDYFITLPIKPQIEELLRKPNIKVIPRSGRSSEGNITDIFHGSFYKNLLDSLHDHFLTVTFNTDGVAVHDSTSNTLWPIFLNVNEICPEERFKTDNLILAGLWFKRSAPNMSLFLKPFIEELLDLSVNGVDFVNSDKTTVKYPVYPLFCSVDSVAKPKLVCQKQFNAYSGCLYCFHPNDSTVGIDKKQRYYDTSKSYSLRTEDDVIRDMLQADTLQRQGQLKENSVNGFIGISVLLMFTKLLDPPVSFNSFNIVWGFVIDYMHCILEGVSADLFGLIDRILTLEDLKRLDARCNAITPPQAMTRRPRSFTNRVNWKAREFRAFLLYYSLPCLEDLLPKPNFANLKLFVNAVHILLSDNISSRLLSQAKSDLHNFTVGYQRLYGLENVTYNLHLCTHLADLVQRAGPLWSYSNFVFESGNGFLLNFIKGTKSIIHEIAVKYSTVRTAAQLILTHDVSPKPLEFCREILAYHYSKSHLEVGDVYLPSQSVISVTDLECELLKARNVNVSGSKIVYFPRAIRSRIVYCSKSYSKTKVYDDSCVLLNNGTYATIDKIVKSNTDELLCIIKPIQTAAESGIIKPVKKCALNFYGSVCVVPFNNIVRKCVLVTFEDKGFVCHIPNLYERD